MVSVSTLLLIASIAYIVYFRPKFEESQNQRAFDDRVLGFIDGLYISGVKFGCTDFEMRHYVKMLLSKAHALPGNQFLMEHITAKGWGYTSRTGLHGDHMTFALLCVIQYAKECENNELISLCEDMLVSARVSEVHYH